MKFKTIEWKGDRVRLLDQRRLPQEVRYIDCKDASSVAQAIRSMAIRGAPAIGVAAAMGIALAAKKIQSRRPGDFRKSIEKICRSNEADPTHGSQSLLGDRSNEEDIRSVPFLWCR